MTKEFYQYLFELRSSGLTHTTKESVRQFIAVSQRRGDQLSLSVPSVGVIEAESLDGEVGSLGEEPLQNFRNAIISLATTMNLIASDHHADQETAYILCDFYINKADMIRSKRDFERLSAAMFRDFQELYNRKPWGSFGRTIDKCVEYIYQNLYSPLTVEKVATYANYSPSYLTTLFKEKTGQTLYSFIQQCRISEATRLLTLTDQSISSIAASLGYHSPSHFSKAFKKVLGISPLQYRITDPVLPF